MSAERNPMGRNYSPKEIAAAVRCGVARWEKVVSDWGTSPVTKETILSGQIIWATGPHYPSYARKQAAKARKIAADWDLLADAMDREWKKELP